MLDAKGDLVLFTDADLSTPISELGKLKNALEEGRCDIAIGSRMVKGAEVERWQKWPRVMAGRLFGRVAKCLLVRGIADTQKFSLVSPPQQPFLTWRCW